MKTDRKFTVIFTDGTEKSGLSFKEADRVMAESEDTTNPWTRVFFEAAEYKAP